MRKAWYGTVLSEILTVSHNSQIIGDKASLATAGLQTVVESWSVVFANGAPCGITMVTRMLLKYRFIMNSAVSLISTIEYFVIAFATVSSGSWRVRSSKSYDEQESHPSPSYPNDLRGAVAGHARGFVTICSAPNPYSGICHLLYRLSSPSSPVSEIVGQVSSAHSSEATTRVFRVRVSILSSKPARLV